MYPAWYLKYEYETNKRIQQSPILKEKFKPDFRKVCAIIKSSFSDVKEINNVLWEQLCLSHPNIRSCHLNLVYDCGWGYNENTKALRSLLETLINQPTKPFNESDYL